MQKVIGVDPGKNGAVAYISDGKLIDVVPFKKDIMNCRNYTQRVRSAEWTIFIEKVHASPQMGVISAFTFGKYAEAVETAAHLSNARYHIVKPATWQGAIGCFAKGDKGTLLSHAKQLFPQMYKEKMFNRSSADAVLIAYYGWKCCSVNRPHQK
jgi:hypothetical protein